MKNVTFISAGAGSGKTYSLTKRIVEFIKSGTCAADEIILTTFTRAAAGELREKVRSALYAEGLYDAAVQIDNAAIGTIHSIAYQIVARYWYLLGISADVKMIAEEDQSFYISQSLSSLPSEADLLIFRKLQQELNITYTENYNTPLPHYDFWKSDLRHIIDKINDFSIDADGLTRSRELNKELIAYILKSGNEEFTLNIEEILGVMDSMLKATFKLTRGKPEQTRDKISDKISKVKKTSDPRLLNIRERINLINVSKLTTSEGFKALCRNELEYFETLKNRILADPRTYVLIEEYINSIFKLAQEWQTEYENFKRERRLLDFNDVQRYFSKLLNNPDVVAEIQSRYKIAFVDEFQDCSPQQVAFFGSLSELMQQSVWVGDIKQAIYGFRGTDTKLITNIIEEIDKCEDGNRLEILDKCWRSNRTIVNTANSIFSKAFSNTLDEKLVKLGMPDGEDYKEPKDREIRHWHFTINKAENRINALAEQIKELHDKEGFDYKDIAVLCRINKEASEIAMTFGKHGIPCCQAQSEEKIKVLLSSLVSFAANENNELSKAHIAYYTQEGFTTAKILSDRIEFIASDDNKGKKWLSDIDLFGKLSALGKTIKNQSVAFGVETLLVELNAADIIRRIDPKANGYDYCQAFIAAARKYEQQCTNFGLGCSLAGFVNYVNTNGLELVGSGEGVTVTTYHKSKGLEWKCVILWSLNDEPVKSDKIFSDVQVYRNDEGANIVIMPNSLFDLRSKDMETRITESPVYKQLYEATFEESKRLMYVGMTRPKELLVTVTAKAGRTYGTNWLNAISGQNMNALDCQTEILHWCDCDFRYTNIVYNTEDVAEGTTSAIPVQVLKMPAESTKYSARDIQPSRIEASARLQSVETAATFSQRGIARVGTGDDAALGNCLHHLMCIWRDDAEFQEQAAGIAEKYGIQLDTERFMESVRAFYSWLESEYGAALSVEREVPFTFKRDNGQIVGGEIDMLYRTANGDVLIDYKTYSGAAINVTNIESDFYAGKYSGQIEIYEEALLRSDRTVRDKLICYLSLGIAVRMNFSSKPIEQI